MLGNNKQKESNKANRVIYVLNLIALIFFLFKMTFATSLAHFISYTLMTVSLIGFSLIRYGSITDNNGNWREVYHERYHTKIELAQFALIILNCIGIITYCMTEVSTFTMFLAGALTAFGVVYVIFITLFLLNKHCKMKKTEKMSKQLLKPEWEEE